MVFSVSCPECNSEFPVDSAKVPEEGVLAQCSMCPGTFFVERPQEQDAAQPADDSDAWLESVSTDPAPEASEGEESPWLEAPGDLPESGDSFEAPEAADTATAFADASMEVEAFDGDQAFAPIEAEGSSEEAEEAPSEPETSVATAPGLRPERP